MPTKNRLRSFAVPNSRASHIIIAMKPLKEQYLVDANGSKTAVMLPFKRYERLLEDMHDLAVVAERREEKPISLKEMKRRLKRDGII